MKIVECVQGDDVWTYARLGIPTASAFGSIIQPKKLQASAGQPLYRAKLLAEWLLGYPVEFDGSSAYAARGKEMEPRARGHYELSLDIDTQLVGFVLRDDEKVGGSPDALVGDDGGVDFKCPAIHTHISYLITPQLLEDEYRVQVQGYMYLTDRAWWDLYSYNPELPAVRVRVERDEKFIAALDGHLAEFVRDLDAAKAQLAPFKRQPVRMFEEEEAA